MARAYRYLGMLEAAEELFRLSERPSPRSNNLNETEYYRMDEEEGVAFLKRQGTLTRGRGHAARRLARAGLLREARDELASFQARARQETDPVRKYRDDIALRLTQGEIALAEGNAEEAISLLLEGVAAVRITGAAGYFRGAESLANAWELQGDLDMALQTLEDASQQKNRAYPHYSNTHGVSDFPSAKLHWMRVRLRLAQLYLKLDREAEALEIEAELRELLRYADPDLWLVRQLGGVNGGRRADRRIDVFG